MGPKNMKCYICESSGYGDDLVQFGIGELNETFHFCRSCINTSEKIYETIENLNAKLKELEENKESRSSLKLDSSVNSNIKVVSIENYLDTEIQKHKRQLIIFENIAGFVMTLESIMNEQERGEQNREKLHELISSQKDRKN